MFITQKVMVCFEAFEVMKRADCEYVPSCVFERIYEGKIKKHVFQDAMHQLGRNQIIEGKTGPNGGVKQVRPVSFLELMRIFCPTRVPEPDEELYRKPVNRVLAKLNKTMSELVFVPAKVVPLDFCLDDDDVNTASKDAHGPTEGHLCK